MNKPKSKDARTFKDYFDITSDDSFIFTIAYEGDRMDRKLLRVLFKLSDSEIKFSFAKFFHLIKIIVMEQKNIMHIEQEA